MSTTEYDANEDGASTAVEERRETTEQTAAETADPSARPSTPSGANPAPDGGPGEVLGRDDNQQVKPAGLCHHAMESGFYCQSPALRHRRYCYSHLRLLGQRLRMARAIARRQPYRFDLPALDDLFAVQAAVEHVARALGAGLLERRQAGTLLYALQQSAINHRIMALLQMNTASVNPSLSNPTLSPKEGEEGGAPAGRMEQKRLVEEYPEFEAEFGLPPGIDLSQPAHVVFPPPEDAWRVPTPAHDPKTSPWVHRQPSTHWTKEQIELEGLQKCKEQMNRESYNTQAYQIKNRISKQAQIAFRKRQEAAWQVEADRRNTSEEEQERQYAGMDEAQRSAYHLGVLRGLQAAQEQAEEEARKKPAAKAAVGS